METLLPHGHCYLWRPEVLWLHVLADGSIAISFCVIPLALLYLARHRPDLRYSWILYLFGGFIFFCGTSHALSIVTIWVPIYRLEGIWKVATAAISACTAILIWPLVPHVLQLPSTRDYRQRNRELQAEVERRERAERELQLLNERLEQTVGERTRELEARRRELSHANSTLERTAEELESYASVISHDLKAPLRGISNLVRWLREENPALRSGTSAEHVDAIQREVERMRDMIEGLLRYARADRLSTPEPIDPNALLRDLLSSLAVEDARITVEGTLPNICYDPIQLMQVFQNLLGNAIAHALHPRPRVSIGAEASAEDVTFWVEDDGPGIPPQHHARAFEIFQRLDSRPALQGDGMGLAIVKKIVETNEGRIWLETSRWGGLRVKFSVPRREWRP